MVGGSVLGGEGRRVAEGYAPYLGVGYCREGGSLGEKCFEGLPRGVRGDVLACRGHPYMFLDFLVPEFRSQRTLKHRLCKLLFA
jgi:hypothetical protein